MEGLHQPLDVLVNLFVYALASATISKWLAQERGPFAILERLRDGLYTPRHDASGRALEPQGLREEIGMMVRCHVCNAPYVAIIGVLLFLAASALGIRLVEYIAFVLAAIKVGYIANTLDD